MMRRGPTPFEANARLRVARNDLARRLITKVPQRDGRNVFASFLTFPPGAGGAMFSERGEVVVVKRGPDEERRFVREWIVRQQ